MPEENEQPKEVGKPAGVPSEHAVFVVPMGLLQSVTSYLTTKPYREVAPFLQELSKIKAQDARNLKE